MIEVLESRRLFSNGVGVGSGGRNPGPATFVQDGGTLTISNATSVQINDYDVNGDPSAPIVDGTIYLIDKSVTGTQTTVFTGVTDLIVNGTRSADIISVSLYGALNAAFYGGAGSDGISVGNNGSAIVNVFAGNGNDSLFADNNGTGSTTVYGEGGRDTFDFIRGGAVFVQ